MTQLLPARIGRTSRLIARWFDLSGQLLGSKHLTRLDIRLTNIFVLKSSLSINKLHLHQHQQLRQHQQSLYNKAYQTQLLQTQIRSQPTSTILQLKFKTAEKLSRCLPVLQLYN